jgi:glutathione S-transferase
MTEFYRILGSIASPYSLKMRAVFRYRRIPHIFVQGREDHDTERSATKVPVIPIITFPDGTAHNDSTPLIYQLETLHPGLRSVVPDNPAMAFLAFLLEDMADEWGTKMMFHYRWYRPRDQQQMSHWLAFDRLSGNGKEGIATFANAFRERQTGRMAMVGCTDENAPIIEGSFKQLLTIFEEHVPQQHYLFGSRPSLADFSWYGQMSQLIVDPTPSDLMRETAPYTMRWIMQLDDASGVDGEWEAQPGPFVEALLHMAGQRYLPFLAANAKALMAGATSFEVAMPEGTYRQNVFKYQAKCLMQIREAYAALPETVKTVLTPLLTRTKCLANLESLTG